MIFKVFRAAYLRFFLLGFGKP